MQNATRNRSVVKPVEDLKNVIKFPPPATSASSSAASTTSTSSSIDKTKPKAPATLLPKVVVKPVKREKVEGDSLPPGKAAASSNAIVGKPAAGKPVLPLLTSYDDSDDD